MSSRWWRAYDEAVDDPKLILLSDKAHRAWFNLMCIASLHGGILPDIKVIAVKLRVNIQRAAALIAELVTAGLFDRRDDGRFEPHNWSGRQFQSDVSTDRVKRFRNAKRNVSETPPENRIQKQSTETEKKETRVPALAVGWPADFREQFWQKYPNKVGKPKALTKLEQCMRRGIAFDVIMSGLDRYIHTKPADRTWLNPETFINQERWTDEPAMSNGHGNSGNHTPPGSQQSGSSAVLAGVAAATERRARERSAGGLNGAPPRDVSTAGGDDPDAFGAERNPAPHH